MDLILISSAAFAVGWYFGRLFKRTTIKLTSNMCRQFGAATHYYHVPDLIFEGKEVDLLLTRKEIEATMKRAYTNEEDI